MNKVRLILAAALVLPSLLVGMHNNDDRVAYESEMVEKIKPLLALQDVVFNQVLTEYPDEGAALNRFVMNVHEHCVGSSNQMCADCHLLLQTTVKLVKPLLQDINKNLQQVELMNNVDRDHYSGNLLPAVAGVAWIEPRTVILHGISIAFLVQAGFWSIYHTDPDIALYGCYALVACLIGAVFSMRTAPVPSSVITMQVLYCLILANFQNYFDRTGDN